jgi:predicted metal-binding protein
MKCVHQQRRRVAVPRCPPIEGTGRVRTRAAHQGEGTSRAAPRRPALWQPASWARREGLVREALVIAPYGSVIVCRPARGIAMRTPGKFTSVVGDIKPGETDSPVIECATLDRGAIGFLPREQRALALRGGIAVRVPPLEIR